MINKCRNKLYLQGVAWQGGAGRGKARHGKARQGKARYFLNNQWRKRKMKKYKVEIKGVTPLLQNKPVEYGFDEQWVEKKASEDWEKEALKKLYMDMNENIYQPSTHLEQALIEAGKKIKVKGQGKATYSKLFGSMVSVEEFEILHIKPDYEIHKALVVIPSTKGRVMRYRPIFKEWKLVFHLNFEDEIPQEVIKEALEIAGRYVGIGDWRPQKKGKFGKFQVTNWQES